MCAGRLIFSRVYGTEVISTASEPKNNWKAGGERNFTPPATVSPPIDYLIWKERCGLAGSVYEVFSGPLAYVLSELTSSLNSIDGLITAEKYSRVALKTFYICAGSGHTGIFRT